MTGVRRIWAWSFVVGTALSFAAIVPGIARVPTLAPGFYGAGPEEERWATEAMPAAFADHGREIGVARWTPENNFGGSTAWYEERSMVLGPMAAAGGYLNADEAVNCWRFRCGWPLRSLEMSRWSVRTQVIESDSAWMRIPGLPFRMPLGVRVPQLLGNIAFFSATLGIVLTLIHEVRIARRQRAGACEGCGHLLAGASRCPECGREVAAGER